MVVKRIISSYYDGDGPAGIWYPNEYCVEEDKKAFLTIFYERELDSNDRKIFDQIMSTFEFTE